MSAPSARHRALEDVRFKVSVQSVLNGLSVVRDICGNSKKFAVWELPGVMAVASQ